MKVRVVHEEFSIDSFTFYDVVDTNGEVLYSTEKEQDALSYINNREEYELQQTR